MVSNNGVTNIQIILYTKGNWIILAGGEGETGEGEGEGEGEGDFDN